jgi:hypothetical protein
LMKKLSRPPIKGSQINNAGKLSNAANIPSVYLCLLTKYLYDEKHNRCHYHDQDVRSYLTTL